MADIPTSGVDPRQVLAQILAQGMPGQGGQGGQEQLGMPPGMVPRPMMAGGGAPNPALRGGGGGVGAPQSGLGAPPPQGGMPTPPPMAPPTQRQPMAGGHKIGDILLNMAQAAMTHKKDRQQKDARSFLEMVDSYSQNAAMDINLELQQQGKSADQISPDQMNQEIAKRVLQKHPELAEDDKRWKEVMKLNAPWMGKGSNDGEEMKSALQAYNQEKDGRKKAQMQAQLKQMQQQRNQQMLNQYIGAMGRQSMSPEQAANVQAKQAEAGKYQAEAQAKQAETPSVIEKNQATAAKDRASAQLDSAKVGMMQVMGNEGGWEPEIKGGAILGLSRNIPGVGKQYISKDDPKATPYQKAAIVSAQRSVDTKTAQTEGFQISKMGAMFAHQEKMAYLHASMQARNQTVKPANFYMVGEGKDAKVKTGSALSDDEVSQLGMNTFPIGDEKAFAKEKDMAGKFDNSVQSFGRLLKDNHGLFDDPKIRVAFSTMMSDQEVQHVFVGGIAGGVGTSIPPSVQAVLSKKTAELQVPEKAKGEFIAYLRDAMNMREHLITLQQSISPNGSLGGRVTKPMVAAMLANLPGATTMNSADARRTLQDELDMINQAKEKFGPLSKQDLPDKVPGYNPREYAPGAPQQQQQKRPGIFGVEQ